MSIGQESCPGCIYSGHSHLEGCPNGLYRRHPAEPSPEVAPTQQACPDCGNTGDEGHGFCLDKDYLPRPAVAPRETQTEAVKEAVEAFDPFRRIFAINKQLKPDDNTPFIRFVAGVWPTWGDFKRLVNAMKRLENGGR